MVGGFGQSPCLRNYLQAEIPPEIEVIQVVNGWTAVVRGALTKALADTAPSLPKISIEARVARKHYGIICTVQFDPEVHDENKSEYLSFRFDTVPLIMPRYWDYFDGEYVIDVMHWSINKVMRQAQLSETLCTKCHTKGDEIKEAEPIKTDWVGRSPVADGALNLFRVSLYELDTDGDESAPMYFNRSE